MDSFKKRFRRDYRIGRHRMREKERDRQRRIAKGLIDIGLI